MEIVISVTTVEPATDVVEKQFSDSPTAPTADGTVHDAEFGTPRFIGY